MNQPILSNRTVTSLFVTVVLESITNSGQSEFGLQPELPTDRKSDPSDPDMWIE